MQQEVYADLYFLVNLGMDLLCLMMTAALTHRKILRRRAIAGAAFGGAYALAALLLGFGGVLGILTDLLVAHLMCAAVFSSKGARWGFLWKATAVYLLTSGFLGGVMTALYAWLNRLELPLDSLGEDGISVWLFAILAAISGFLTTRGSMFFGLSRRTRSVELEAVLFGRAVKLRAMVDSGNLLRDPMSGRRVIVVERTAVASALPQNFPREGEMCRDHELARRLRLIPAQTATGEGMLVAILPDSLTVIDGEGRRRADYLIAPTSLSGRCGDFDALIPMD